MWKFRGCVSLYLVYGCENMFKLLTRSLASAASARVLLPRPLFSAMRPAIRWPSVPHAWPAFDTLDTETDSMQLDLVMRKRRLKMKKHKLKKRRKRERSLKKRLGKL